MVSTVEILKRAGVVLAAAMILGSAGCSGKQEDTTPATGPGTTTKGPPPTTEGGAPSVKPQKPPIDPSK